MRRVSFGWVDGGWAHLQVEAGGVLVQDGQRRLVGHPEHRAVHADQLLAAREAVERDRQLLAQARRAAVPARCERQQH